MKVRDFIEENKSTGKPVFSFEILPPLKGNSIQKVYNVIDKLKEFGPKYINITSHHSETVYVPQADGNLKRLRCANVRVRWLWPRPFRTSTAFRLCRTLSVRDSRRKKRNMRCST